MTPPILRSPNLADGEAALVVRVYEKPRPMPFKNGGLARSATHVRSAGRGGDEILLHINPQEYEFLKSQWGEPSTNPHTGLPEYGLFSKIKKALKFEAFNVKKIVKGVWKNPTRLLTGAVDPLGTKISNKMFGQKYDPLVNQLGGATEKTFQEAEAKGMDTGLARNLHKTAGLVAGFFGGNALGNLASTGLGNVAQGLQSTAAANTLSPMVTTAQGVGSHISPVVVQAGQTGANAANLTGTIAQAGANAASSGSGALANLGKKAVDYAKQPKNWGNVVKYAGALGALGGAGGAQEAEGAPDSPQSPGLKQLPYNRAASNRDFDWYTYGQGPEQQFYSDNAVPAFTPDEEEPVGAKHGGSFSGAGASGSFGSDTDFPDNEAETRFVRGPGTGRSDSIDAQLSDGEYVLTAEDVALLGDGSSDAGAKRLDEFRANLRKHKGGALARGKISPNAKSPMSYLKGRI
jgi:hypothetical protein